MKHTVKEVTLKNGAKGLVIRAPGVQAVSMVVEFRAGFDTGNWDMYELPHVVEHLMFTNKTYPKPRQFSKEVEKNGAYHNAHTSSSSLTYDYECASFEAERIAELIAIQITEPTFPQEELKTEIGNVREELSKNISDPGRSVRDLLYVAASDVPSLKTRIEQLPKINREHLENFYEKTHRGGNMNFILAGDIDFEPILKVLDVKLPDGKRLDLPYIRTRHVDEPIVETRDIPQIYYSWFTALKEQMSYRELVAARIISSILSNGFSSTLLGTAREKGLVYGFSMGVSGDPYETGLNMGGFVTPDNAKPFFELTKEEINKVLAGKFSQRTFDATKRLMQGQRALSYQRISNLVNFYDSYFTMGYTDFEDYNRYLKEITKEEAVAAFNRLFTEKCWGISFVGNVNNKLAFDLHKAIAPIWNK